MANFAHRGVRGKAREPLPNGHEITLDIRAPPGRGGGGLVAVHAPTAEEKKKVALNRQ
jgi:hypothetical protein